MLSSNRSHQSESKRRDRSRLGHGFDPVVVEIRSRSQWKNRCKLVKADAVCRKRDRLVRAHLQSVDVITQRFGAGDDDGALSRRDRADPTKAKLTDSASRAPIIVSAPVTFLALLAKSLVK